ncbi:Protein of unknown function [Filimonas lacunae]|uniref:Lysozyme inhibitor LprI-like N-terminal domain-containing protein n=1 Tax=Filimonas lacunae TaxID=477680 RepID=A0A173MPI9_9BACT|nr:lysozyme inhibitor LprI family protein [Filimonas lacunae]BAV09605.1 hypothetical protein FLA_5656 [Filimonas lacunae]SIS75821.1 Protein of unknown function [Filimonas lacunae]
MNNRFFLLVGLLFTNATGYAQSAALPVEVTPAMSNAIQQEVKKEETAFAARLKQNKTSDTETEFILDTFRVNRYMKKYMDYDFSTAGMRTATYEAAEKYDSLLNKYYKQLLVTLTPADRPVLIAAQRAWLVYRDSETKLVELISKEQYSGGGTMQQLIEAGSYLNRIKERTDAVFEHYKRASQQQ